MSATLSPARLRRTAAEKLTPEQYVLRFGPPSRLPPGRDRRTQLGPAGGRLDRLVLRDLAAKADWQEATWGEHAYPSVPAVAERIGYSDRAVQYALRRLTADGYLELLERPGRTNVCRVVRHLELVDPGAFRDGAVDDPVDDGVVQRVDWSDFDAVVAPGGATAAPDLDHPPTRPAPVAPIGARKGNDVGPDGPAHAPPGRRGGGPGLASLAEALPAALGEPRLTTAGRGEVGDAAPPPPPEGAATPRSTPLRESRAVTRHRRCPKCLAPPGRPCVGKGGRLRSAHHAERRRPVIKPPDPAYFGALSDAPDWGPQR